MRGQRGLNKLLVGFSLDQQRHLCQADQEAWQSLHPDGLVKIDEIELESVFSKSRS